MKTVVDTDLEIPCLNGCLDKTEQPFICSLCWGAKWVSVNKTRETIERREQAKSRITFSVYIKPTKP